MMMMMATTDRLSQILHVGELAALRGAGEVRRKLVELGRLCRIAVRRGGFSGVLQVRDDLLGDLLVLGWLGSWPLCEALVKSVASWLSWTSCVELPSAVAVLAAFCRFVAICWVTCLYSVGFDC